MLTTSEEVVNGILSYVEIQMSLLWVHVSRRQPANNNRTLLPCYKDSNWRKTI